MKFSKIKSKIKVLEAGIQQGKTPLSYLELGLLYQTIKDYSKAETAFQKAASTLPNNIYPRFLLMRLYEVKGERVKVNQLAQELAQVDESKMSIGLRSELHRFCFLNSDMSSDLPEEEDSASVKMHKHTVLAS